MSLLCICFYTRIYIKHENTEILNTWCAFVRGQGSRRAHRKRLERNAFDVINSDYVYVVDICVTFFYTLMSFIFYIIALNTSCVILLSPNYWCSYLFVIPSHRCGQNLWLSSSLWSMEKVTGYHSCDCSVTALMSLHSHMYLALYKTVYFLEDWLLLSCWPLSKLPWWARVYREGNMARNWKPL